jgi:hypothetical protein
MLSPTDLIHLTYPPDLTEAGLLYTCQWLAGAPRHLGDNPHHLLRRKISQVAFELAFRRLLVERNVPFRTLGMEPFTDPNQHDLSLAGCHCHLNSYLISRRSQIRSLRSDPAGMLQASALIPLDQFVREGQTSRDLYLFGFLLALTAVTLEDQRKVMAAGQPHYYFSLLPGSWSSPDAWLPLKPLSIQSESAEPVIVELGGQNADRRILNQQITLLPGKPTLAPGDLYSLSYIHMLGHPNTRLQVHSPRFPKAHSIQPTQWVNLWVYGMDIWLMGWLAQSEYRRRSILLPEGQVTFQFERTRAKNLAVPIKDLHPMSDLFEQVHTWDDGKKRT